MGRQASIQSEDILEILVDELVKDHPDESFVKQLMKKLSLKWSEDRVECMNVVLQALHADGADEDLAT